MVVRALDPKEECFGAKAILNGCEGFWGEENVDKQYERQFSPPYFTLNDPETGDFVLNSSPDGDAILPSGVGQGGHHSVTGCWNCEIGAGHISSKKTILVLGDSHAQQYINLLSKIGKEHEIRFIESDKLSTCFALDHYTDVDTDGVRDYCKKMYIYFDGLYGQLDGVIFSTLWGFYYAPELLESTIASIRTHKPDMPFYIMEDIPWGGASGGYMCYKRGEYMDTCRVSRELGYKYPYDMIETLAERSLVRDRDYQLVETNQAFCDNAYCYSYIGGITPYFNNATYDVLEDNPKKAAFNGGDASFNPHLSLLYTYSMHDFIAQRFREVGIIGGGL
ncbi:hypothetical protein FACS1894191_5300 [Clostridia bacterium]|nr:hypothetical protein FACS1894191_5300 [Clostridia bacterium]